MVNISLDETEVDLILKLLNKKIEKLREKSKTLHGKDYNKNQKKLMDYNSIKQSILQG